MEVPGHKEYAMKTCGKNDMVKPATEKRLKKSPKKSPKKSAKDRKLGK